MKDKKLTKTNALVEVLPNEYNGRTYTNLRLTLALDNKEVVECLIDLRIKDNNVKRKLLYKISQNLGGK